MNRVFIFSGPPGSGKSYLSKIMFPKAKIKSGSKHVTRLKPELAIPFIDGWIKEGSPLLWDECSIFDILRIQSWIHDSSPKYKWEDLPPIIYLTQDDIKTTADDGDDIFSTPATLIKCNYLQKPIALKPKAFDHIGDALDAQMGSMFFNKNYPKR